MLQQPFRNFPPASLGCFFEEWKWLQKWSGGRMIPANRVKSRKPSWIHSIKHESKPNKRNRSTAVAKVFGEQRASFLMTFLSINKIGFCCTNFDSKQSYTSKACVYALDVSYFPLLILMKVSSLYVTASVCNLTYSIHWYNQLLLWTNDIVEIDAFHFVLHMHQQQCSKVSCDKIQRNPGCVIIRMTKMCFGPSNLQISNILLINNLANILLSFFVVANFLGVRVLLTQC